MNENLIDFNDPIFSIFYTYNKTRWSDKQNFKRVETQSKESPSFIKYTLNKPSFACFTEIPSGQKKHFKPNFDLWIEATSRAILDSKFKTRY